MLTTPALNRPRREACVRASSGTPGDPLPSMGAHRGWALRRYTGLLRVQTPHKDRGHPLGPSISAFGSVSVLERNFGKARPAQADACATSNSPSAPMRQLQERARTGGRSHGSDKGGEAGRVTHPW